MQLLEQFQVKANLIVPILVENIATSAVELWGLFIVHQCSAPRQWQAFEVELLNQLTVQLAIAIQQAQLYRNLQTLNTELEAKVHERTTKLQESDRRFRAIFNNTFQFTGLLTPSGILLEANQTALSFGGLQLEDVIDRPFWEAHWWTISPQTQEELKQAIAHAAKGKFVRYEVDVLGANERVATIDFSLRPLQDETGKVVLLIPEGRDITERKQTELVLHERKVMLHLIGDNLPNGAVYRVIRELDGSDRFSYLSGGIERLMEVKVEDALRDSSLLYRQFIPEDIPRLQEAVEESRLNLSVFDIQLRIRTPSGQLKWFHFRSTPRQLQDGRVAWDGLVVDVTDLKNSEETLRKSQALLEESQRVARLGNWEFELASGKITWSKGLFDLFNREFALLEPSYEENLQLYHPEDREKLHQAVERAIATGESYKQILRVTQNGSNRYFEGIGHTEFNADGEVIRLYGTAQDVTEREIALRDRQKAEETLRQSEAQLATTQQIAHIGSWEWNLEAKKRCWSRETFHIFGLNPTQSEPTQPEFLQILHPEDRELFQSNFERAITQKTPLNIEYRVVLSDGSVRYLEAKAEIAYDPQGKAVKLLGYVLDITQRKQAEAALARSEEQLRLTLEFNHIGLWDWNVETGEVIWNDNHFRLLGLEPETSAASYQLWRDCVHREDVERIEQAVFNALAEHINFRGEYRVIYPDGSVHWLTGKGRGVYNEAGDPVRMLGLIIDISDRKRAEQMLELQAVITRNMAEGICLVRAIDGVFVYTNPKFEQMFGYEPDELTGQHVSIVNYGDEDTTPEEVNQAIRTAILQHGEATYEVHNVKKDGTPFWCRSNASIFGHPEYGSVIVAVHQDITEHKQAEEKIIASLKEKEVLLKEIHHRVKNNLGIVSSLLQMQCRRTQDPVVTALLRDSQNRIASIALVHEKLYRSEDLADIDFAQYIPDLTTHLFDSYNVNSSQIHLKIQVDDASLDIETAIPCGLIINELVSNALKYAFVGNIRGEIEVKFYQKSESILTLIIRDNGIGLPENFDSKKAKTLGITLVQGLVKQLRGKLEIASHQGTQFKITFTNSRI
ncbi:PAS domain-containing protein [Nostoc sp. LEGE 12447]|uniref:PAS domain-containing protein n=1 Tax=Nostoc sp. LEGE 12447 TaxID=1828640 RepID=UPI001D1351B6|nr:PAS domain-containing protein [Nostoc sp. LEGE 12447]